jgi:hypothetical protein
VTQRTERPPVRARSGRRPLPPLIFLLVLALAALGVWWNVLRQADTSGEGDASADAADCSASSAGEAPPSLDPATISVRVFNATDTAGLAQSVAEDLQARGFVVDEIANDPTEREVTGVGEVRHGPRGNDAAAFLALVLPDAGDYLDTRATEQVDLVLGPEFAQLATPEEVAAALDPAQSADDCATPAA